MRTEIIKKKPSISRAIGSFFLALSFFFVCGNSAFAEDGQTGQTFLVDKTYDFLGRSQATALLLKESDNAYFYFDKDYYDSMTSQQKDGVRALLVKLGKEFDVVIYPGTKDIFGDEWNPGIDGNEKITVLFTRMNYGVGGYFNPNDEYDNDQIVDGKSNEREIIYLNADYLPKPKVEGFLSHEFQHMIYWNEKTHIKGMTDDIWINEGRSELAAAMVESAFVKNFSDGTLSIRKKDFLLDYTDSLVDWNNINSDYASVSMFMQYLKDQIGTEIFRQMNGTRKTGIDDLSYILEIEKGKDLTDVFTSWTIANYINDTKFDARYGYRNDNLKTGFNVSPESIYDKDGDGVINLTGTLKNWSANYFKVDVSKEEHRDLYLEVDFNGEDAAAFSLPVVINYKDGSRKVDSINLNSKQDGHKEAVFVEGNISSIVFIPSSQKIDETLNDNQAQSHPFSLDVKLTPIEEKMLPNGSLIRAVGEEKIYLIEDGKKRWITDSATFVAEGYDWGSVIVVSKTELGFYWEGESIIGGDGSVPEGALVEGSGPKIYHIEDGQRRWIVDEKVFVASGFDWNSVIRVSDQELFRYKEGRVLAASTFADGALIRGSGAEVYLVQSGKKCWIVSPETFSKNNYNWLSVVAVSEEVLSSYTDGPNID